MSDFISGLVPSRQKLRGTFWPLLIQTHRLFTPRLDLSTLAPILILGNQKTGSTAIAQLLAALGNLHIHPNIHALQAADTHLPNAPEAVASFIQRSRYYFRADVVKENELTPATGALLTVLPNARPVYVVRHPVQNIRSILDRVQLPGDPQRFDALSLPDSGWSPILTSRPLGIEAGDHITALARRWSHMTALYLRHRTQLHLVRYEDFVADKLETIQRLASRLGIETRKDIRPLLDVSFQPSGAHRSTPPEDFFSSEALAIIHRECAEGMAQLDYDPIPADSSP
ncbi:sulfotransferase family protein [Salinibacter ruber]|jgi:hypothetical protein|uniref:Sulfotransferase n=1 Tax=Salinibacter ruber TaxID=146919 RepID=A0A9X2UAY3_9BACT|nr:sulfotransferase [Salinibacter ruber]MCS3658419.1 hypothetical protein [Salinibacter ruber]MCS3952857.1 hypothetical protein [Salinibacter ruber]MCS4119072.1 hypothetical protein [Salinibacter ruber]MCS4155378.1 hypothetical protein [Salinibacter ruber]MCS4171931.1 hypothetical protein [Salinibacter ruber]